jgi:hypothetical protein
MCGIRRGEPQSYSVLGLHHKPLAMDKAANVVAAEPALKTVVRSAGN